jgi:hypothetical protein
MGEGHANVDTIAMALITALVAIFLRWPSPNEANDLP